MLWKSNLWPNLLWYHEEPVSRNHCNPWHRLTARFPRALAHHSLRESSVMPSVYIWATPLPNLGNNIQTTLRSLLLFFQNESVTGSLTMCGSEPLLQAIPVEQAGLKRVGRKMRCNQSWIIFYVCRNSCLPVNHPFPLLVATTWMQLTHWVSD